MSTKPTALNDYLARATAVHAKLARLQQLDPGTAQGACTPCRVSCGVQGGLTKWH